MKHDDEYIPTDKQMEILELVYTFRFINRKQIQRFFGHKDPKRVNTLLKDLFEHNYLGRFYSHKLLENTKPAIYYLANEGIGWVRANHFEWEPEKVKRFYQDKHASKRFISHNVTLCDLYLQYKELADKSNYRCDFSSSTLLWYNDELKEIRPDALIEKYAIYDNPDEDMYSFFLELIEPYVPMYALRYKIDKYIAFRGESDEWDIYSSDMNTIEVRMILPTEQKLRSTSKHIKKSLEANYDVENIKFLLTTYKKAIEEGVENDIWKEIRTDFLE